METMKLHTCGLEGRLYMPEACDGSLRGAVPCRHRSREVRFMWVVQGVDLMDIHTHVSSPLEWRNGLQYYIIM